LILTVANALHEFLFDAMAHTASRQTHVLVPPRSHNQYSTIIDNR
jgi:hypothetical protein